MKEKKYSLNDLYKIIFKNIIWILVLGIIGGGIFYVYAKHKETVTYTAERSIVISHSLNTQTQNKNSQVNADLTMVPTYADMIAGPQVTNETYKLLPKKVRKTVSKKDIIKNVNIDYSPHSLVMSIKVTTDSAKESVAIVNQTAQAAKKELPKMQDGIGNIYIYPKATTKDVMKQVHTSTKKYTLVGVALGILAGMIISFAVTTWKKLI